MPPATFPYRLGRLPTPAHERARNLMLVDYLTALPAPPTSVDYSLLVPAWPMFGNDVLGDCTAAGAGHLEQVWSAEVDGTPTLVTDDQVIAFYALQGYRPGDPSTDRGADMLSVLRAWRKVGIAGHCIQAFTEVHSGHTAEVRTALWLFSGLYCGCRLPASAMQQFQAHQPWDVVAQDGGIEGGHCIVAVACDAAGLTVVTWGALQRVTWAWWTLYVDEVYAAIGGDYERLGQRLLPNGFNVAQLRADLARLG